MQTLTKTISGMDDASAPDFDADKVIAELQTLLNPVVSFITSLPVPPVPGLGDIGKLLSTLSSVNGEAGEGGIKMPNIEPSPTLIKTLKDLLAALQSLCVALPMVLINLLF